MTKVLTNLFPQTGAFERLHMRDANVYLLRNFITINAASGLMNELVENVPWRAESVVVVGKRFPQPRLVAWYGDQGRKYSYSGLMLVALPWTRTLLGVKRQVENRIEAQFNSLLLNYYRNNRDSIGLHSDDEPELGERPVIASLSLGEIRTIIFRHKAGIERPVRFKLESGSLLLMKGDTQKNWRHGIEKEDFDCGARINLTFRHISP